MRSISLVLLFPFLASCEGDAYLRGDVSISDDGNTYFTVVEDNGEYCYPIKLDGKVWDHALGELTKIEPGLHVIEACGKIEFNVPEGTIFKFDYWGP